MKKSEGEQVAGARATATKEQERTPEAAGGYHRDGLSFSPEVELNLPTSYEEVVARFKRLQASRAMESMN